MDFKDNKILIQHLRKGEERAYMYLLDAFHKRLHAYALTLIDDYSMAQDIVQNVFLKTWQYRNRLDTKYSIQNFLYKSVYNEFINKYQKNHSMMLLQRKYVESLDQVVQSIDDNTLDQMVALVTKEIQNLPPKCGRVFSLSKHEGLTNQEISEYLEISIKTVEAQISKAYSILRNKLGDKIKPILFLMFGFKLKFKKYDFGIVD